MPDNDNNRLTGIISGLRRLANQLVPVRATTTHIWRTFFLLLAIVLTAILALALSHLLLPGIPIMTLLEVVGGTLFVLVSSYVALLKSSAATPEEPKSPNEHVKTPTLRQADQSAKPRRPHRRLNTSATENSKRRQRKR
jgi:hypothetical protein